MEKRCYGRGGLQTAEEKMGWTMQSLGGQPQLDEKRFLYAEGLFKGRWPDFRSFERCSNFYSQASARMVPPPVDGSTQAHVARTVWDIMYDQLMESADFGSQTLRHSIIFKNAFTIQRHLKTQHPEFIADCVKRCIPMSAGNELGKCGLCPSGLGNPAIQKITDEMMLRLLENVAHSMSNKQLQAGPLLNSKVLKSSQHAASKKVAGKPTKKQASSAKAQVAQRQKLAKQKQTLDLASVAEDIAVFTGEDGDLEHTTLGHITSLCKYLYQLDSNQGSKVEPFKFLLLYGSMTEDLTLNVRGKLVAVKGLSSLRKILKQDIYTSASLKPRLSDPDCGNLETTTESEPAINTHRGRAISEELDGMFDGG